MLISSCRKYLDAKPDKALVVPSTLADIRALLDNPSVMNSKGPFSDEALADNYFLPPAAYQAAGNNGRLLYTWSLSDYTLTTSDWSLAYEAVYYSNIALENLTNIQRTESNKSEWDNIMGMALLFRARSFLHAAFIYAKTYDESTAESDLGIVIRTSTDFNIPSARTTVKRTYDQVISDIKIASGLLPEVSPHPMRPAKVAAYGLLSRAYLSMRKYDSCFKYADLCLQFYSQLMDYNTISVAPTVTRSFSIFNPEVIWHQRAQPVFSNVITTLCRADSLLYQSYETNDLRKNLFWLQRPDGYQFRGSYNGNADHFNGIATDEIYLMRAECLARSGRTDEAMSDLNKLLIHRWKTGAFSELTANNADDALRMILTERRKELVFRGLRWMDIKRLNKEAANISIVRIVNGNTFTLPPNDNRFALALPSDLIAMWGLLQNPG